MRFQMTKIIGFVGFVSFILWSGLMRLEPTKYSCKVNYYGIPNMSNFARIITKSQKLSYDYDYNYHRYVENIKNTCSDRYCELTNIIDIIDNIDNIEYYGHLLSNGNVLDQDVEALIEQKLYDKYDLRFYDLVLSWNTSNAFCKSIFNVSDDMSLKTNDIIDCYEPIFSNIKCQITLTKSYDFESYIFFFTCLSCACFSLVLIVTFVATIIRFYRYCRFYKSRTNQKFGFDKHNVYDEHKHNVYEHKHNIEVRSISPSSNSNE